MPYKEIISLKNGRLEIGGKQVDLGEANKLRDEANKALDNKALQVVWEQTAFTAVLTGIHKAENSTQMFFAKACIWWGQKELELLTLLAQRGQDLEQ